MALALFQHVKLEIHLGNRNKQLEQDSKVSLLLLTLEILMTVRIITVFVLFLCKAVSITLKLCILQACSNYSLPIIFTLNSD